MPTTLPTLSAGSLRLELNPSIGGSISRFEVIADGVAHSLSRNRNGHSQNVLEAANFPLVPYVNRIRGGAFEFRGRTIRLQPNMSGDPSPLHGQGWLNPWTVEALSESTATLTYDHPAGEWPWHYQASQEFVLDSDGLTLTLSSRNLSDEPMPCGLGQHPYFPCGAATRINTAVDAVWTIDEQVLPVARIPAEGRFDLHDRLICGQELDHGFDGWSGTAFLTDPDWPADLRLSSPDARFFQLYSPAGGGLFVAEPVSHANAALNEPEDRWSGLGLRILDFGETMSLTMRIDVVVKSRSAG